VRTERQETVLLDVLARACPERATISGSQLAGLFSSQFSPLLGKPTPTTPLLIP
jgi:hypothetical protein